MDTGVQTAPNLATFSNIIFENISENASFFNLCRVRLPAGANFQQNHQLIQAIFLISRFSPCPSGLDLGWIGQTLRAYGGNFAIDSNNFSGSSVSAEGVRNHRP
ncbi:MAG TPA: hypothetical protein VMU16_03880 [Candidatus Binataceae bacterium]|nr:hypothetical protein [Candidatus Binataceae bacterium]